MLTDFEEFERVDIASTPDHGDDDPSRGAPRGTVTEGLALPPARSISNRRSNTNGYLHEEWIR